MAKGLAALALPALSSDEIVAVDPGKHTCAVAIGDSQWGLSWAGPTTFAHSDSWKEFAGAAIVEVPSANGRATPPDDLIAEAVHGCLLAGRLCSGEVRCVTPNEWKGSTRKPIHHDRMWGALSAEEQILLGGDATYDGLQAILERGAKERWRRPGAAYYRAADLPTVEMSTGAYRLTHNELDAVALLLFALGRIDRDGMPAHPKTKGHK